jgi:hypothetical protein
LGASNGCHLHDNISSLLTRLYGLHLPAFLLLFPARRARRTEILVFFVGDGRYRFSGSRYHQRSSAPRYHRNVVYYYDSTLFSPTSATSA